MLDTDTTVGTDHSRVDGLPQEDAAATPLVFLHSSWRTSSTWAWLKFREQAETIGYYEPFHGLMATRSRADAKSLDYQYWDSSHPPSAPYLLEYVPLIRESGGVPFADAAMPFEWCIPLGGLRGQLRESEQHYLSVLLRHAELRRKLPVFGDTRTLGRLWAIKNRFGGFHISLHRNLWQQWASYLHYKRAGNLYFFDVTAWVLASEGDPYFTRIITGYGGRQGMGPGGVCGLVRSLPDADVFEMFMALHLYLYLHADLSCDLATDVTRMARDETYRRGIESDVRQGTGLSVSFADVRDERRLSAAEASLDGIDWDRVREHGAVAARALGGFADVEALSCEAAQYVEAAFAEACR
jgi:hypothetical protein